MALVSVITPCFNVERYLPETIRSVLGQTFADWEHIVVDDGSTDGTGQVADEWAATETRIKVIHQANAGAPAARVRGYQASDPRARYLLWLDGDDILEPNMLEVLVGYLNAHPQVGVVLSNRQHIDEDGKLIMLNWHPTRLEPGRVIPIRLRESTPATSFASLFVQDSVSSPSATLIRRDVYDRTAGWDVTFGQPFEDWDLIFHLALVADVHYVPMALTRYRLGRPGQSTTSNAQRGRRLYHKLYDRWSRYEGVPREKMDIVHRAIHFREGRALPFQHFAWGTEHLRHRQLRSAMKSYARSVRYLGVYMLKSLTGTYRARFVDAANAGGNQP